VDIEDRNFHHETKRNPGAEHHFRSHTRPLPGRIGFEFTPAPDRQLRVVADAGRYHDEAEWTEQIRHPIEESRGQTSAGDAFSPGWFRLPLVRGKAVTLFLSADSVEPSPEELAEFANRRRELLAYRVSRAGLPETDAFGRQLAAAVPAFVVKRRAGTTVIAGYPWFLDWGRDSLICARGLRRRVWWRGEAALVVWPFEKMAPCPTAFTGRRIQPRHLGCTALFGIVCEELTLFLDRPFREITVDQNGRTSRKFWQSIAEATSPRTPNGIRVDAAGPGLSPSHFTWMDTNHPAGTPRAGYPVEIQVSGFASCDSSLNSLPRSGESWACWRTAPRRHCSNISGLKKRLSGRCASSGGRGAGLAGRPG
jgi:glycogen debranching enzyme